MHLCDSEPTHRRPHETRRPRRFARARVHDTPKTSGRRVRGEIFDYLGELIVTGSTMVGESLPGQVETAQRLDISRGNIARR